MKHYYNYTIHLHDIINFSYCMIHLLHLQDHFYTYTDQFITHTGDHDEIA